MDYRKNLKEEYLRQSVMTASPAELTAALFGGCIKDLNLAEAALQEPRDISLSNSYFIKAQNIISELANSLDMNYEISQQLLPIYMYLIQEIRQMNVKKDLSRLPSVLEILTSQRETWESVARASGTGRDNARQACI